MKKDKIFAKKKMKIRPFRFNKEVVNVFDDMLTRSVPFYNENIKRQAQLIEQYYRSYGFIYDLGCSHGNLGELILEKFWNKSLSMIAVDNSLAMVKEYSKKLKRKKALVDIVCADIEDIKIKNASIVILNLTLQFLDPSKREKFIKNIFCGMLSGGILLVTEKTINSSKTLNKIYNKFHEIFKLENGYSNLEISQKRTALEKVLVPDTIENYQKMILDAGFTEFDVWQKWFNFASMIAMKK